MVFLIKDIEVKLLMATCSDDSQIHAKYTLPIHRMFAHKWNAEFRILDDQSYNKSNLNLWNYRTMIFHELLETYDRILYLDSDIVINRTCPNIFNVVPFDTIGLVFEDKGSRLENRRKRIAHIKNVHGGNEDWISGYFNGGMLIVSRLHKEIFTKINGRLWGEDFKVMGGIQAHLGYQIMKQGHKYIDLGYKWNHMSMFSEPWNGSPSRFDSYIIHYAGGGRFPDKGERNRVQLIKDDIEKIYGDN